MTERRMGVVGRSGQTAGEEGPAPGAANGASSGDMLLPAQLIGELIGLLAHDLRNPLSALHSNLGYLDAVLPSEEAEAREAVEDGVVSCDGLSHVIDNVDLLGQILRGGLSVSRSPFSVAALLAGAVERCQPAARSHGLKLELDAKARQMHVAVDVGRDLATRALTNLIRNSIQHAPSSSTVLVSAAVEGTLVCVYVQDSGSALTDELVENAFTAEGQVAAKLRANSRYSRGMGLYCARIAARLCGADVRVMPTAKGNTFQLALPQVEPI